MSGPIRRPRYADVVATLALVVAMSGTAYAVHALPKNSVSSKQIKNNKVKSKDLEDGGVTAEDLAAASVGSAQLSAHAVEMAKLADDAVGSTQVADNTLTPADLKGADVNGAVTMTVAANTCTGYGLSVSGAEAGDAGFFTWRTAPPNLLVGPLVFDATNHATVLVCNPSASTVSVTNAPTRILTFRS